MFTFTITSLIRYRYRMHCLRWYFMLLTFFCHCQLCVTIFKKEELLNTASGSASGSFYHKAKIVRKTLITVPFCDFFMALYLVLKITDENGRIRIRGSGSISQRYESADPDPYQNFTGSATLLDTRYLLTCRGTC